MDSNEGTLVSTADIAVALTTKSAIPVILSKLIAGPTKYALAETIDAKITTIVRSIKFCFIRVDLISPAAALLYFPFDYGIEQ
jgi:hypothetical protein